MGFFQINFLMQCHALPQVKYDTFITVYMSDCDFYPRVRAAGYQTLESYNTCPELEHLTVRQLLKCL